MNLRPLGYEPNELPDCSTPRQENPIVTRTLKAVKPASLRRATWRRARPYPVAPRVHPTSTMPHALNRNIRGPEDMAKILVVEDNDDVREMMAVTLQLEGHKVVTAVNGRDALEKLRTGEKPCLILLDLMMPVMNGWELRSALQQDPALRSVPVVVVSAATGEIVKRTPADAFLSKPVDMDRLLDVVCDLCERGDAGRV